MESLPLGEVLTTIAFNSSVYCDEFEALLIVEEEWRSAQACTILIYNAPFQFLHSTYYIR